MSYFNKTSIQTMAAMSLLVNHFKDIEKAVEWFITKNPSLGGVSPQYMLMTGREKKLFQFIETSLMENERDHTAEDSEKFFYDAFKRICDETT